MQFDSFKLKLLCSNTMGNTCSARPCSGCCGCSSCWDCTGGDSPVPQKLPRVPQGVPWIPVLDSVQHHQISRPQEDARASVVAAEHPAGEVTRTSPAHDQAFAISSATAAASIHPTTTTVAAAAAKEVQTSTVTSTNRISEEASTSSSSSAAAKEVQTSTVTSEKASTSSSSSAYHAQQSILHLAEDGIDADLDLLVAQIRAYLAFVKGSPSSSSGSPKPNVKRWKLMDTTEISKIKDFCSESADAASSLKDSISDASGGDVLKSVAKTLLNGVGKAHWVAAGLVAIGFVLDRVDLISSNKSECIDLLDEMSRLAEYLHKIKQKPKIKEHLATFMEDALQVILKGTIMCFTQCTASNWFKFFAAQVDKKRLQELKEDLDKMYRDLTFEVVFHLYDAQESMEVFPRKQFYPCHAVISRESLKNVIGLLELESHNKAVAMIIYGFGGIGKTTLADAVYASLEDVDDFRFCRAVMYDTVESKPDLTKVQKKIRDAILQKETTEPESPTQGQMLLLDCLKTHSCVIYLDNVLGIQELAKCLPQQLSSSKKLRLLITARDASVQNGLTMSNVKLFPVDSLPDKQAQEVLETHMGDEASTEITENDKHDVAVNICGGVPLLIELVGRCISHNKDKAKALQVVRDERRHSQAQSFGGCNVDIFSFTFNDLQEHYQHAFLDICGFFSDSQTLWLHMERIFGVDTMLLLESRALVKSRPWQYSEFMVIQAEEENALQVHDVILERARERYMHNRITSISQFQRLPQLPSTSINDVEEVLQRVMGVSLKGKAEERLQLSCESLDAMSSSLRIFDGRSFKQIQGECKATFSNLIYWRFPMQKPPFELSRCRQLRWLAFATTSTVVLDRMPPSLVVLEINYVGAIEGPAIAMGLSEHVPKIEVLTLGGEHLTEIPVGVLANITSLSKLCIGHCKRLNKMPDEFHCLPRLKHIFLTEVPLENIPQSIGNCVGLRRLSVRNCDKFTVLPEGLEQLSSLESLQLSRCKDLAQLFQNIDRLVSLRNLLLFGCRNLRELGSSFHSLPSLQLLDVRGCIKLESTWVDVFAHMKSLKYLNIRGCPKLTEQWHQIDKKDVKVKCIL